jgi:hypothetical protein
MRVYIGAAIDNAGGPRVNFELLTKVVLDAIPDAVVYNPFSAFSNASSKLQDLCSFVVEINEKALTEADLAVFLWNDAPSFGLPIEIQHCKDTAKPFAVWYRSEKTPGIYLMHGLHETGFLSKEESEIKAWLVNTST